MSPVFTHARWSHGHPEFVVLDFPGHAYLHDLAPLPGLMLVRARSRSSRCSRCPCGRRQSNIHNARTVRGRFGSRARD